MIKVFVFGTLTEPDCVKRVLRKEEDTKRTAAKLLGYRKVGLNILEVKGEEVLGYVLEVTQEESLLLDYYEGVPTLYKRINVNVGGEDMFAYQLTERERMYNV